MKVLTGDSPFWMGTRTGRALYTMQFLLLGLDILIILELCPLPHVSWPIVLCSVCAAAAFIYPYIKHHTRCRL